MVQEGLEIKPLKKFESANLRDLFKLTVRAIRYEAIFREEQDRKVASKVTYYRDPNCTMATTDTSFPHEHASC